MDLTNNEQLREMLGVLVQALAAAEAECAEWREKAGCNYGKWSTDSEENYGAFIPSADANDATRARLGLGRIGEAR
jgi:hypothetical protein